MKNRKNIFAVEGGVGCGKSSVAEILMEKHNYLFIKEYMEMLNNLEIFFQQSPENRLNILFDLEKEREQLIINADEKQKIVMDRCVLCLFAHEYATKRLDSNYRNDRVLDLISQTDLLIPNIIFFLITEEKIRRKRCATRKTKMADFFFQVRG